MRVRFRHIIRNCTSILRISSVTAIVLALILSAFVPVWHVPFSAHGPVTQELQSQNRDLFLPATILEKSKQSESRCSVLLLLVRPDEESSRTTQGGRFLPPVPDAPPTLASLLVYTQTISTYL